jgi:hypothetical protein
MGTQRFYSRTNLHVAAVWNANLYEIIAFWCDVNNGECVQWAAAIAVTKFVILSNTDSSDTRLVVSHVSSILLVDGYY